MGWLGVTSIGVRDGHWQRPTVTIAQVVAPRAAIRADAKVPGRLRKT